MNRISTVCILLAFSLGAKAQEKWDLRKCVEHAMQNNINVRQSALQKTFADIQYKQSQRSQLPTLNLNNSYGMSFGRRENPTTGIFEDQRFFNTGLNMQSGVSIFNWFSRKNQIASDQYEVLAATTLVEKNKNDVALAVAALYLTVLQSQQQTELAKLKLEQSRASLVNTRKLVDAGTLPELNAAELEAQMAQDSSNYVAAKGLVIQNLIDLKNLLNIDIAKPFEIATPPVDKIPVEDIASLQPDAVYNMAVASFPQQQYNTYKYQAAEKLKKAAWGAMKPTVSAFGGLSTNYIYFRTPIPERVATGQFNNTGLVVNTGTTTYNVLQPEFKLTGNRSGYFTPTSFFKQFGDNFGQNIGIGISVPILNGGALRANYDRTQAQLKVWELTKEQDNVKLKLDIYKAYNQAVTAMEKFNAGKKTLDAAKRSNDFAHRRYDVGMLNTLDLIINDNNLFRSQLEYLNNQFEYVFRMKVLEFYKGQGLKL